MSPFVLLVSLAAASPGEVQLWVDVPDDAARERLRALPLGFAEGSRPGQVRMVGRPGAGALLDEVGLRWAPILPPPPAPAGYTSTDDMVDALDDLATSAPDLVERVDAGRSVDGRPLVAVRISATRPAQARLGWRILGAHHGDELSSAELALQTAQALVAGYGEDATITRILDRDAIWLLPHVNPDGVAAATRTNARGVDLNRNYSHEWTAESFGAGGRPFSEPETRAVRALSGWVALGAGLSMHSGAANLGWVWNHTSTPSADAALLSALAEEYAASCTVDGFWVTNGADWYTTNGDTNDWSYGRHGVLDFTLEASVIKTPPASDLDDLYRDHIDAVIAFLDEDRVLSGQVLGPDGTGVQATIEVDAAPPLSTGPAGRFGRPVAPGPWTLTASAPGFAPLRVTLDEDDLPAVLELRPDAAELPAPRPALLGRGGDGSFVLTGLPAGERLELVRTGEEPVPLERDGDQWWAPLPSLQPGPWSLRSTTGAVARNAVFIGEHASAPRVSLRAVSPDQLDLSVAPVVQGARAWALVGPLRQAVELTVHTPTPGELRITLPPSTTDPLDVLLLADGHQLALLDLFGTPTIDQPVSTDTGTPSHDTGRVTSQALRGGELTACGCAHAPGSAVPALLLPTLLLFRRRRQSS